MKKATLILTLAAFSGLVSAGACPSYPIGVTEIKVDGEMVHVAVARAEAFSESDDSIELASAEARVAARKMLLKLSPELGLDGRSLRGAMGISTCHTGGFVFATVLVSERNIIRANRLRSAIENSINKSPTPKPGVDNK